MANYENKKIPYKGEVILCERGAVNLSVLSLAERWGWDRRKVRRFLKLLESDGMCTLNSTTHRTTITIENYGKYQDYGATDGTTNSTTNAHQVVHQMPITNKNNKYNNYNNKPKQNKFNQFPQNTYDFDELEKRLMRN